MRKAQVRAADGGMRTDVRGARDPGHPGQISRIAQQDRYDPGLLEGIHVHPPPHMGSRTRHPVSLELMVDVRNDCGARRTLALNPRP